MDWLSERFLGHKTIPFAEVAGAGRNFIGFARAPIDKATQYAAEDADVTLRLWRVLKPRLVAEGLTTVYETLERPLVVPLAQDGDARHFDRSPNSLAAVGRIRAGDGADRGGDPGHRRRAVQSRLAQTARRHPVRPDGAARRQEDRDRRLVDLGERARRPGRGGPPTAARAFSTGGSSPSSNRPTPTRCRTSSIRARVASTPPTRWLRRRPAGSRLPSRTCRTFRSATRRAARSAAPSSPGPATS